MNGIKASDTNPVKTHRAHYRYIVDTTKHTKDWLLPMAAGGKMRMCGCCNG